MDTRQKKRQAYNHIMKIVLECNDDDPIMQAMSILKYEDISDIETMSEEEIMQLTYIKADKDSTGTKTLTTSDVPMKQKKMLLHVLWWRDYEAEKNVNKLITADEWLELDEETFENFRCEHAANMTRTVVGSKVTSSNDSSMTSDNVTELQKSHKRDVNVYLKFAGDRKFWFRTKRNWTANVATDGIGHILSSSFDIPKDGSVAKQLFLLQNRYF